MRLRFTTWRRAKDLCRCRLEDEVCDLSQTPEISGWDPLGRTTNTWLCFNFTFRPTVATSYAPTKIHGNYRICVIPIVRVPTQRESLTPLFFSFRVFTYSYVVLHFLRILMGFFFFHTFFYQKEVKIYSIKIVHVFFFPFL